MAVDLQIGQTVVYSSPIQFCFQFWKDLFYFIIGSDVFVIDILRQEEFFVLEGGLRRWRIYQFDTGKHPISRLVDPNIDPSILKVMQFYLAPHGIHEAHAGIGPIAVDGDAGNSVEG